MALSFLLFLMNHCGSSFIKKPFQFFSFDFFILLLYSIFHYVPHDSITSLMIPFHSIPFHNALSFEILYLGKIENNLNIIVGI
jgi:hypothetical protein